MSAPAPSERPPRDRDQTLRHPLSPEQKEALRELHAVERPPILGHNLCSLAQLGLFAAALATWSSGWWPLTLIVWIAAGQMVHLKILSFHEAAHGLLHRTRWRNEIQGVMIGTLACLPLSAYRFAHQFHHAYLAGPKDFELWPFTIPGTPRPVRVSAAMIELLFGFIYTPLLFLRAVLVAERIPHSQRRRICWEYALCVAVWTAVLSTVAVNRWWTEFLVAYGVPVMLGGFLQSLRKYTEHLGLAGDSPLTSTRTVVHGGPLGRLISLAFLNGDYHGAHHVYARLPWSTLPHATQHIYASDHYTPKVPLYRSYLHALLDMLPSLADPKVGRQWIARS